MRFWVVDDDAVYRRTTEQALRARGCEVQVFAEASACVVALSDGAAWPEAILVDSVMPVIDGLRLTAMIRALPRGAEPVIWVVSAEPGRTAQQHLDAGADGFSPKPFDVQEMIVRCATAAARRARPLEGTTRVEAAVLFADLRGFTSFSNRHDPETVVDILSGITTGFVQAVEETGGWIDKILGDGVIALFGVPRPHPQPVLAAARAACNFQRASREFFRSSVLLAGRKGLEGVGCGLTHGEVVAGRMGPPGRQIYTAIGSPMNLAARIQGVAAAGETLLGPAAFERLAGRLPCGPSRQTEIKGFGTITVRPLAAG
ncbi:MAG: adenylate/guanylate cyclase domain-containing response regulator [Deltaproteobacteria bacterium]|nr:adenylate/guanylate cyclase domain-containing response regulator [Deltaproteobacteria bacterium]